MADYDENGWTTDEWVGFDRGTARAAE
jgi:hypothetical protein